MEDSTETRQTGGTELPKQVWQALNNLRARCRAWDQFQEHAHELKRITDNQLQKPLDSDLFKVETAAQVWLNAAESAETAGVFASSYCFLLRVYAVERVYESRCSGGLYNADLAGIKARMDAISHREGLTDDEYWPIGQGPKDWEELADQYSQVLDGKFEEALREYGLNDIADLYHMDRESYNALREQGRRLSFEDIPKLEQLSALQKQFEAEAEICAKGGAYHAAGVMIGSAMEAALLFTCLNHRDDALNARDRLPDGKRPKRTNPESWKLHELVMVADEAGWLPDFEVAEGTIRSRRLLDMMRFLRNLVHPACHLSDKKIAEIKCEYTSAQAAYTLLKGHLAAPRMSPTGV